MTKIKAVLDQETWVEVDVPDEFQAIVSLLFHSEAIISGSKDNAESNMTESYTDMVASSEGSEAADTGLQDSLEQNEQTDSSGTIAVNVAQGKAEVIERKKSDAVTSSQSNSSNMKERGKPTTQMLEYGDVGYHMVNWLVIFYFFYL